MKTRIIRTTLFISIIVISIAFAGCYFVPEGETGSVTIDLGKAADSRALTGEGDIARVYLLSETGAVFDFGGGALYAEGTVGGTITVENVPAEKWNVLITVGKTTSDGAFVPTDYGESGMIEITPGVNNPQTITMDAVPFTWSWAENLAGVPLSGVVTFGDDTDLEVYTSSEDTIFYNTKTNLESDTSIMNAISAGTTGKNFDYSTYTINSISKGEWFDKDPELWVNTNKGIVPLRDNDFKENFQSAADPAFGVWKSGGYYSGTPDDNVTIFYRSTGGFGGVSIEKSKETSYEDYNWENYTDFEEALTGELVYDFFLKDNYAYFASALGSFRLNTEIVESADGDFFAEADFFEVVQGEGDDAETVPVNGVGYLPVVDQIVMATDEGIFLAELDDLGNETLSVQGITETLGEAFSKVAVSNDGTRAAAVTATRLYLLEITLVPTMSIEVESYGFHAGYPGGVEALQWTDDNELLIAGSGSGLGTAGLVSLSW